MKKILITGMNSYIGTSLNKWLMETPDNYIVDTISVRDDSWKNKNFNQYDVVFHVAGIAHIKETKENRQLYYRVNRDLAYEVAEKAKSDGVKQFIFLSSMSVYGIEKGIISKNTIIKPTTIYGKTKIEAEGLIKSLENDLFLVSIVRPPMVYGRGCKGNYSKLSKLVLITPIFPELHNQRSMIYIDNLSEFIKQLIDNRSRGIFFPQNSEFVNTSKMVRMMAKTHGKKIIMTKVFNPIIKILNISILNKVFGDLVYEQSMSDYEKNYRVCKFKNSIEKTEM